jgi:hypothetical protein
VESGHIRVLKGLLDGNSFQRVEDQELLQEVNGLCTCSLEQLGEVFGLPLRQTLDELLVFGESDLLNKVLVRVSDQFSDQLDLFLL